MRLRKRLLVSVASLGCVAAAAPAQQQPSPPPPPPGGQPVAPGQPAPPPPPGEQPAPLRLRLRGDGPGGGRDVLLFRGEPGPREKGAFLGVSTSPPVRALREQLKLPPGTGLMVDFVAPDSPAAAAGVKQFDVITKLNDQVLINAPQLMVLVRTFKPGDEVTLMIIREGQPTTVKAKLVERELGPLEDILIWSDEHPGGPGGFPGFRPERFEPRRGDPRRTNPPPLPPPGAGGDRPPGPDERFRYAPRRQAIASTTTWTDGEHTLTVTAAGPGTPRRLVATDRNGTVLHDGPIDSDEDRKKLPTDVADKLKRLEAAAPKAAPAAPGAPNGGPPQQDPPPPAPGKAPSGGGGDGGDGPQVDVEARREDARPQT